MGVVVIVSTMRMIDECSKIPLRFELGQKRLYFFECIGLVLMGFSPGIVNQDESLGREEVGGGAFC